MKLSEILAWHKKDFEDFEDNVRRDQKRGFNTALTSCDREIDREALAMQIKHVGGVLVPNLLARAIAESIISTMPTWLRKVSEK